MKNPEDCKKLIHDECEVRPLDYVRHVVLFLEYLLIVSLVDSSFGQVNSFSHVCLFLSSFTSS
jgi:hypothetical protein